jgi:hypothetical protein
MVIVGMQNQENEENALIVEVENDDVVVIEVPKESSTSAPNSKHRLSGAIYSLKCNVCEASVTQLVNCSVCFQYHCEEHQTHASHEKIEQSHIIAAPAKQNPIRGPSNSSESIYNQMIVRIGALGCSGLVEAHNKAMDLLDNKEKYIENCAHVLSQHPILDKTEYSIQGHTSILWDFVGKLRKPVNTTVSGTTSLKDGICLVCCVNKRASLLKIYDSRNKQRQFSNHFNSEHANWVDYIFMKSVERSSGKKSYSQAAEGIDEAMSNDAGIPVPGKQEKKPLWAALNATMVPSAKMSKELQEVAEFKMVVWLAECNIPPGITESEGFKDFCHSLHPGFQVPGYHKITR